MADEITADMTEVRVLADVLRRNADRIADELPPIMTRAGMNMKRQMTADLDASTFFKGISRSVTFDVVDDARGIEVQIGPDKNRGGALGNVAYFGTSRGGGTVPDPVTALEAEAPRFVKAIEKLAEDLR
jgi:hypothetical protein